jgi:predicted Rossmann fold nucleotide-binding protein DprA/Smf involved in DNA uptake
LASAPPVSLPKPPYLLPLPLPPPDVESGGALAVGTNRLLRDGAAPLTSAADVLDVFGFAASTARPKPPLGAAAGQLFERLRERPASVDELARAAGMASAEVSAALTELELAGAANAAGGLYRAVVPAV